jgi:hypothetical protein
MKKFRIFVINSAWSELMFIFDENIKFSDIKKKSQTNKLTKNEYIGTYELDKKFLSLFNKDKIGDDYYFYRFLHYKDDESEEKAWQNIPEYKEKPKEYKNIETESGESSAAEFDSLFD